MASSAELRQELDRCEEQLASLEASQREVFARMSGVRIQLEAQLVKEMAATAPPVDLRERECVGGMDPDAPDHRELKASGQQKDYVVLSAEERAKGFVRPVRRTYVHDTCRSETSMGMAIAETYARHPEFYGATFCVTCGAHFPVGEHGQFRWLDGARVGT